jgi:hypothetical protein
MSMSKLSFWNFLGEFNDGYCHGVLPAWWDAHHISMRAHFMRWCRSAYMEARFQFLFNNCEFVHVYDSCPQIALYEWALVQCLNQVTFMAESFLSEIWMRNFSATSQNCSIDGVVVIFFPQSYLDISRMKPWLCISWSESFWRGFPVLAHSCSTH